jgi:hypothetical protein
MRSGDRSVPSEDSARWLGIPLGDVVDVLRSEPALAWFLAQGLWLSQPVLEIFWDQDQIAQAAELLETVRRPGSGGGQEGQSG